MIKLFFPAAALVLALASSQAETTADRPHTRLKQPETVASPPPPPIAEWFGNAVGEILTGADKALNPPPPNQPTRPGR